MRRANASNPTIDARHVPIGPALGPSRLPLRQGWQCGMSEAMSNPDTSETDLMQPVAPVRPAAAYIGGKRNLAKRLVALIDEFPHTTYAEVFVGMGGVFFRRTSRPKSEVINDYSQDVSTFFRVLQHHYVAFLDMLRFQITSRANFEILVRTDPSTLTDLQRSARFLYLQKLAFGGRVTGQNYGVRVPEPARFDVTKLQPMLEAIHERLASVIIERLDWSAFIDRYDRAGTLLYLDPPYFGCEGDYGPDLFDQSQFEAMAAQLAQIKGGFILSLNDCPEVRQIFAGFNFREEQVTYTVGGAAKAKKVGELIITN